MHEQSKAAKRRFHDGNFASKYFVGNGIDIGCGNDSVGQYINMFPRIISVTPWDIQHGDAQYLAGVPDNSFDFVHSSHCLEHMVDVPVALSNWARVLKPGGHIVVTVPDEDMYEHGVWPSVNNSDHKWSFTVCKAASLMPKSINITTLVEHISDTLQCLRVSVIDEFYNSNLPSTFDQTLTPNAECSIEVVWKKKE